MSLPTRNDDGAKDSIEARFAKVESSWNAGLLSKAKKDAVIAAKKAADAKLHEGFKNRFNFKANQKGEVDAEFVETPNAPKTKKSNISGPKPDSFYEGWETHLLRAAPREDGEDGPLLNADANSEMVLSYDPAWREKVKYNEVTKEVILTGSPLEEHEHDTAEVTIGVKYWMQREYGLLLRTNDVQACILHVAKRQRFDPIREYLLSLEWDGDEYADTWLENYCGVESSPLNRKISRRWLVSAVARALDPGCKVDTMLIMEGGQGIKKSTMLKAMGGEFFCDSKINIDHNDAKMIANVNWIIEMPELASLHASETEAQKAFLSSATDKFRPPYGRVIETFPRRCVFVGSTNDEKYMNDPTGNRRLWPVKCGKFEIRKAKHDRDQIWAHAVAIYQAGFTCPVCIAAEERCPEHRWWFDLEENKELEEANNQRLKSEFSEAILHHLLKLNPPDPVKKQLNERHDSYTMYEIATSILGIAPDRVNSQQAAIGRALKVLGFEKDRPKVKGTWQPWRHIVPDYILSAPQRTSDGQKLDEEWEKARATAREKEREKREKECGSRCG